MVQWLIPHIIRPVRQLVNGAFDLDGHFVLRLIYMETRKKIDILGVPIDRLNFFQALKKIEDLVDSGDSHQVATVNPEFIMHAQRDEEFKKALLNSSLNTADGIGIIWAAKYIRLCQIFNFQFFPRQARDFFEAIFNFGLLIVSLLAIVFNRKWLSSEIPERVTGIDLMWEIANRAQERGWKMYLLAWDGGRARAEDVEEKLKALYPRINIVGTYNGSPEEEGIVERIAKTKQDILFVAFGSPKQERFIYKNLDKLGARVVIGVGGSFDFIIGKAKRAPKFFQSLGIEWLWRFFQQPKRARRIMNAFPLFVWKVFMSNR